MNQRNSDADLRMAAISIAAQLTDGLLDQYPLDKEAAAARLQMHIAAGDVTPEELGIRTHLCP